MSVFTDMAKIVRTSGRAGAKLNSASRLTRMSGGLDLWKLGREVSNAEIALTGAKIVAREVAPAAAVAGVVGVAGVTAVAAHRKTEELALLGAEVRLHGRKLVVEGKVRCAGTACAVLRDSASDDTSLLPWVELVELLPAAGERRLDRAKARYEAAKATLETSSREERKERRDGALKDMRADRVSEERAFRARSTELLESRLSDARSEVSTLERLVARGVAERRDLEAANERLEVVLDNLEAYGLEARQGVVADAGDAIEALDELREELEEAKASAVDAAEAEADADDASRRQNSAAPAPAPRSKDKNLPDAKEASA